MPCMVSLLIGSFGLILQPGIGQNGVFNSASLIPPTLAGGGIARGALFTVRGVRLGSMQATKVTVAGVPARVLRVEPERIYAQMPVSVPLGPEPLVVEVNGESSKPFFVGIEASNPGLFSRNELGWGPGRIDNLDVAGVRTPNSVTHRAVPGQRVVLSLTGLGKKSAMVRIGNREVLGTARVSPQPGGEELLVQVPSRAPHGCFVPVYIEVTASRASNVVTVAIGDEPCGPVPLLNEKKLGVAFFARTNMRGRRATQDSIDEEATITFAKKSDLPVLSPLLLLPPAGACTSYTSSFQAETALPGSISSALLAELAGHGADAGPRLLLNREGETRTIPQMRGAPGLYKTRIGHGGVPNNPRALPLFLNGPFTIEGMGGKDVGAFTVAAPRIKTLEWKDRDASGVVDRAKPFAVHWRADPGSQVLVVATNVDQITTASGLSLCVARSEDGSLTMPPAILANVPASKDIPGIPYDQLYVVLLPKSSPLAAPGVDGGAVMSIYAAGRVVEYR